MTIDRHQGPNGGQEVVAEALSRRAYRSVDVPPLGGTPKVYDPVPVYQLGLEEAAHGTPPSQARRVGWWYPIIGGVEPAFALLEEANGKPTFAGITHGILAKRFYQACDLVDRTLGQSTERYEPRLFDVPALHVVSLWLAGRQDLFVPLMLGKPPGSAPLSIEEHIEGRIKDAAARRSAPTGGANLELDANAPPTN